MNNFIEFGEALGIIAPSWTDKAADTPKIAEIKPHIWVKEAELPLDQSS